MIRRQHPGMKWLRALGDTRHLDLDTAAAQMHLAGLAVSVTVAAELLRLYPHVPAALQKRLAFFIQGRLELLLRARQRQLVQLAGRVLLQLVAQSRQPTPLTTLLSPSCSFLLFLIL